jgi:hypothetical protein
MLPEDRATPISNLVRAATFIDDAAIKNFWALAPEQRAHLRGRLIVDFDDRHIRDRDLGL